MLLIFGFIRSLFLEVKTFFFSTLHLFSIIFLPSDHGELCFLLFVLFISLMEFVHWQHFNFRLAEAWIQFFVIAYWPKSYVFLVNFVANFIQLFEQFSATS